MNVAASTDVTQSSTTSKTSTTSTKTSEKSFDEEMKNVSEDTKNIKETNSSAEKSVDDKQAENKSVENKSEEDKISETKTDNSNKSHAKNSNDDDIFSANMFSGTINFTDYKYHNESQNLLNQNIQCLLDTKELMTSVKTASSFDYNVINMSDNDANFFVNLVQNTDMSMKDISSQIANEMANNSSEVQKNIQVSSVLMEKLAESLKTNMPFRIDFDKDISVIIKVNKDGSLMANFIPGDKAVEQYLKNNIAYLKERFDEQDLSYSQLSYSNSRENRQQKRKKENDNE